MTLEETGTFHGVAKRRRRFLEQSLDGLVDESRPGRQATITTGQVQEVMVATLGFDAETRRWSLSAPAPSFRFRTGGLHHLREGGLGYWTALEEARLLNRLERHNQPLASVVLHVRVRRATGVSFFAGHSGLTFIV